MERRRRHKQQANQQKRGNTSTIQQWTVAIDHEQSLLSHYFGAMIAIAPSLAKWKRGTQNFAPARGFPNTPREPQSDRNRIRGFSVRD